MFRGGAECVAIGTFKAGAVALRAESGKVDRQGARVPFFVRRYIDVVLRAPINFNSENGANLPHIVERAVPPFVVKRAVAVLLARLFLRPVRQFVERVDGLNRCPGARHGIPHCVVDNVEPTLRERAAQLLKRYGWYAGNAWQEA